MQYRAEISLASVSFSCVSELPRDSRDCVGRHLVSLGVEVLNLAVISPFMGNVECAADRTPVWVLATGVEDVPVVVFVQIIHSVVESQEHNLRDLALWEIVWNL